MFAGHSIECESGCDFSDTFSTFGDYEHLYDYEDEEHDDADDVISSDDEVPESVDEFACIPVKQD